ncbi:MAG: hypothetical protein HW401_533 [Parcubacteria group bacterium]|nr:hypothetical protein [Parcubacteria group bacterium]
MPYFVYILFSEKDKRLYVGCTNNLEQRLQAHKNGKVPSTKNRRPIFVIHTEKFEDKSEAFQRERFMKSLWSARIKKKLLKEYMDKIGHENNSG